MKIENQRNGQLELTLTAVAQPVRRRSGRRPSGRQRALWWFREMHRVVDDALGWSAQPETRPRQEDLTWVAGS